MVDQFLKQNEIYNLSTLRDPKDFVPDLKLAYYGKNKKNMGHY